eukprot:6232708-Karenia_brevis.AAC.1
MLKGSPTFPHPTSELSDLKSKVGAVENTCDELAKTVAKISRDHNTGFSELKISIQLDNEAHSEGPTGRPIPPSDDDGMDQDISADALQMTVGNN